MPTTMVLLKPAITVTGEKKTNGIVILSIERDMLEERTCPLKRRIDSLVDEGHHGIVINLELVSEMNSSDIGRLIRSHLALRRVGSRIQLCNVKPTVASLLEITRLDTVFDIYATEEDAVNALTESS